VIPPAIVLDNSEIRIFFELTFRHYGANRFGATEGATEIDSMPQESSHPIQEESGELRTAIGAAQRCAELVAADATGKARQNRSQGHSS